MEFVTGKCNEISRMFGMKYVRKIVSNTYNHSLLIISDVLIRDQNEKAQEFGMADAGRS